MNVIESIKNLSKFEKGLWLFSALTVILSYLLVSGQGILSMIASLIGVTALIFVSKGDVLGQVLTLIFGVLYAVISYTYDYYGEMITYLGMTAPIAALSIVSWLKHPYKKAQVEINRIRKREFIFMLFLTAVVTVVFYYILAYFKTANLVLSTVSIVTSFSASYLMFRRSPYYALAYGANDIVLISLWVLAAMQDISYAPMIVCFLMFFLNDMYGFFNWERMRRKQSVEKITEKR